MNYDAIAEQVGYYFKPFSMLDLREIIEVLRQVQTDELKTSELVISRSALTSVVYDLTCFEALFDSQALLNTLLSFRDDKVTTDLVWWK
jgi:hypothetical protein